LEAFPPKDDALIQNLNVNLKLRLSRPTNVTAASQSYAAAAATSSVVVDPFNEALNIERRNFIQVRNKKRRTNNKPNKLVVGVAHNAEDVHVFLSKKFLHVGKFATDTEPVQAHCPANLDWPRYPTAPLYRSPALSRSRSLALFLAPSMKSPLRFGAQSGA